MREALSKPQPVRILILLGVLLALTLIAIAAFYALPALAPAPAPTYTATSFPPTPSDTPSPLPTATATPSATPTAEPSPTQASYAARLPIFEYHYSTYQLNDQVMMTTDWFNDQMNWLGASGYHAASAAELAAFLDGENIPARSVVLTFDAGTQEEENFANVIIPALRANHLHALFFVVAPMIADTCGVNNQLCWSELKGWSDEGLIDVESHGMNHPDYATITTEQQRWDAGTAKTTIEQKIGKPVIGFAYPYQLL